jgi:hypothetical protein
MKKDCWWKRKNSRFYDLTWFNGLHGVYLEAVSVSLLHANIRASSRIKKSAHPYSFHFVILKQLVGFVDRFLYGKGDPPK